MSLLELVRSAKTLITGEQPKHRPTRRAFRAEETDADLMAALSAADYSHLPEFTRASK